MGNPVTPEQTLWFIHANVSANKQRTTAHLSLKSCISPCVSPTLKSPEYVHTYHCCRHAVYVLGVEVAFSIVWLHNPGQTTI